MDMGHLSSFVLTTIYFILRCTGVVCDVFAKSKDQAAGQTASGYRYKMAVSLSQDEMDDIIYDARGGDLESLKEVFTKSISGDLLPSIKDDMTGSTPIHMAAANGHLETVKYLLSLVSEEVAKELVNTKNDSGNTPLHWACFNGHLDLVKLLVEEFSADVYIKNSLDRDALFEAELNGQTEVENWLLLKFAIEETVSVEETDEGTKIRYTPGQESYKIDEEARAALASKGAEEVVDKTKDLNLEDKQ